ncbi:sugar ABC transporter ATP-binding protein [Nesterenkonia alkaliphila]|uniref:ATP-binding cassette domain-containing protein n=1 Tax=Nesterenkonia alkaliphila TaxID=1463631 RepID=A0A7K1ULH5_9MICC|nr:sugar ABC transporter ATP-binding protein [Nesterenkonia alkaliphila]MVT27274.1 ATP-binding cassette domain-containing protein [Nesterenkonia alkaliphila]GFZ78160.1 sugar ABC transporter ATP-binding protein [Nesterenkonia alkaliphila]
MVTADKDAQLLQMSGIVKHFPGAKALDGVDLDIRAGEVHCLLGQNGAGKSTLIKVLAGVHQPNEGQISWRGEPTAISSTMDALRLGIATMYQELDVVDGLTVAENIFLGHELATGGVLHRRETQTKAQELLNRLGHPEIPPHRPVGQLPAAGKQVVSMARALSYDAQLIIMDEPSAVLDPEEVDNLFRVVDSLTAQGVAVVYISHRLEEIRRIGDRITVLKDGRTVATGLSAAETPTSELISLMTGREVVTDFGGTSNGPVSEEPVLQVEDLAVAGVFELVSFSLRPGEILGLAGLVGAGRSEILEAVYGARRRTSGTVRLNGRALRAGSVTHAVNSGIGLAPEERKSQGLLLDQPIYRNITLSAFARFARGLLLNEGAERSAARQKAQALNLSPPHVDRQIRTLSGGNQQKAMLARWLVHGCQVLLLDEPTRGVDVGARADIYRLIRELARQGTAVLLVSSEIEEVLGLADRVLVVADGAVVHQGPAAEIDEHRVLDLVMEGTTA